MYLSIFVAERLSHFQTWAIMNEAAINIPIHVVWWAKPLSSARYCYRLNVCVCMLSCVWLFATPWTIAHQAPLSVGFSRQEHWSGLPSPSPGDRQNQLWLQKGVELPGCPSPDGWVGSVYPRSSHSGGEQFTIPGLLILSFLKGPGFPIPVHLCFTNIYWVFTKFQVLEWVLACKHEWCGSWCDRQAGRHIVSMYISWWWDKQRAFCSVPIGSWPWVSYFSSRGSISLSVKCGHCIACVRRS